MLGSLVPDDKRETSKKCCKFEQDNTSMRVLEGLE